MIKSTQPTSSSSSTQNTSESKLNPKEDSNSRTDSSISTPQLQEIENQDEEKEENPNSNSNQSLNEQNTRNSNNINPEVYIEDLERGLLESDSEEDEDDNNQEGGENRRRRSIVSSSDSSPKGRKKSLFQQYGGMIITLFGSVIFSMVILLAKVLQDYDFHPSGLSFWRYAGSMFPTIPLILYFECVGRQKAASCETEEEKEATSVFYTVWPLHKRENWKTALGLLVRGILGNAAQILRFFALEYLTVGDTSVISNSSPVLVTILAHFLLGEQTGFVPILTAIVALTGVFIIIRPPILTGQQGFDTKTLIGAGFASGSLLCSALVTILMRKVRRVHLALMVLVFAIVGMAQAFVLTQILGQFQVPHGMYDLLMVSAVAACSFFGQICTILGLKMEKAGVVSLVRTMDVVFGFLFQFIFLDVAPDHFSSIGGSIVFLGILVIAFRKYVASLPEGSPSRRVWGFLLH